MDNTATIAVVLAYRAVTLGGCAYLVEWHGWSPWWFLLVVLTFVVMDGETKKKGG